MSTYRLDDCHASLNHHDIVPCAASLKTLLHAYQCARAVGCDLWQFAVEIRCLRDAGLTHNHLRVLLAHKLIEQADDNSRRSSPLRAFAPVANWSLSEQACFVLTEAGAAYARTHAAPPPSTPPQPWWDVGLRQLLVGPVVVKRFRQPAYNQEAILESFQKKNWIPTIKDPLPPDRALDCKRRLHKTIAKLNHNQEHDLIRFHVTGDGHFITWELAGSGVERGESGG